MKALFGLLAAMALVSPVVAGLPVVPDVSGASPLLSVAEGCGRGWTHDRAGYCVPERGWGREERACPRGYHLGPHRERCWPNR